MDHNILLEKLMNYGIRGVVLNYFKDYLNNQRQYVFINGIKSDSLNVRCGVPQGSILGPILFLLYINDLNTVFSCFSHMFADDTNFINYSNYRKNTVD